MILVTVQFNDIDAFFIRTPAYVGEISVCRITGFQINGFLGGRIEYTDGHFVASHACHRIFVRFQSGNTGRCVHLRIIGYHTLVHTIESEQVSFWTPEDTSVDTEFITVHALSAEHTVWFIGYLQFLTIGGCNIEIVVDGIGQGTAGLIPILIGCFGWYGLIPNDFLGIQVH